MNLIKKLILIYGLFIISLLCAQQSEESAKKFILNNGFIKINKVNDAQYANVSITIAKSKGSSTSTNYDNITSFAEQIRNYYENPKRAPAFKVDNALKNWDCWIGESGVTIYVKSLEIKLHLDIPQAKKLADSILAIASK